MIVKIILIKFLQILTTIYLRQIAGFGVDQSAGISGKLNLARLPVTSTEVCNFSLGKNMTSIEFCAGYKTGNKIDDDYNFTFFIVIPFWLKRKLYMLW